MSRDPEGSLVDIPLIAKRVAKLLDVCDEAVPVVDVHRREAAIAEVLRRDEVLACIERQLVQQQMPGSFLAPLEQIAGARVFDVLDGTRGGPHIRTGKRPREIIGKAQSA